MYPTKATNNIDNTNYVIFQESAMKQFCCGDVVPGCTARFQGSNEEEILQQVEAHARKDHGMTSIPATILTQVRSKIQDVRA